jgi:hypothetical protein
MAGLREFVVQFDTEEKCIEHLAGLRWPGGFACAGCGGRQAWRLKTRPRVYECATCHRQESATARTVFHRTRTLPSFAHLILGDIADTIPALLANLSIDAPLGFVSMDVDYYSSTKKALAVFKGKPFQYLLRSRSNLTT